MSYNVPFAGGASLVTEVQYYIERQAGVYHSLTPSLGPAGMKLKAFEVPQSQIKIAHGRQGTQQPGSGSPITGIA